MCKILSSVFCLLDRVSEFVSELFRLLYKTH